MSATLGAPTAPPLAGRYVVLNVVGQGGMGTVLAAYDVRLDRRVALKLLRSPGALEPPQVQARLLREAQAMARLNHPNVVAVYDAGSLEDGTVFISMEFVEGQTLRQWGRRERSWRELLEVYLAAGKGLAAAHEAGLIHRDFKPDNVLVGRDGRVRVTDFGLARVGPQTAPTPLLPEALAASTAASEVTQTSALMGTPAYMAPELLLGEPADARSDLFAYCVSLYEALYGLPAFPGSTVAQRLRAQREGRLHPPPAQSPVPAWVARILLQGLQREPHQRPASMQELMAALEDDPEVRRRARQRALGLGLGAGVLVALAVAGWVRQREEGCSGLEQELVGVWDGELRSKVSQALLGTGLSYAQDTAERVQVALDDYARDWVQLRTEACKVRQERSGPPSTLALLQVGCLERRRSQLRARVELLARGPDKELLPMAVQAVQSLPPLETCTQAEALSSAAPLPQDPAARAQLELAQQQVDRLEAALMAGKYREGLALGHELLPRLEALGHAPLLAQGLFYVGSLHEGNGDYEQAERWLRQALMQAARCKDDVLVARVWNKLLWSLEVGQSSHPELLGLEQQVLEAAAERAADPMVHAESLNTLAGVLYRLGRYEESQARFALAHALMEKSVSPLHPYAAFMLNNRCMALLGLGRLEAARTSCEQALAAGQQALGLGHPEVTIMLVTLGRTLVRMGLLEEAGRYLERAQSLQPKAFGPGHPRSAEMLLGLGELLLARGQPIQAVVALEHALQIAPPSERAEVQFALAQALWRSPLERARARALATQASEDYRRMGNQSRHQELVRWLLAHPLAAPATR